MAGLTKRIRPARRGYRRRRRPTRARAGSAAFTLGFALLVVLGGGGGGCAGPGGTRSPGDGTADDAASRTFALAASAGVEDRLVAAAREQAEGLRGSDARRALRDAARRDLVAWTFDDYAGYRANAIEALQTADHVDAAEAARRGLEDPNLGVRFVAAMAVGRHGHRDAVPLVHALLRDPDPSVRAAAMFALRAHGEPVDLSPLADLLEHERLAVRSNAAFVLGEIGDPGTGPLLRDALGYEHSRAPLVALEIHQLQIAEALVKVGDEDAVSRIRAELYTRNPSEGEATALAAQMLGRLGARRYAADLRNLVVGSEDYRPSAEVRLAALGALAELGLEPDPAYALAYFTPAWDDPRYLAVRAQAAYVLGLIGEEALPWLAALRADTERPDLVRLSAAAGLLRTLSPGEGGAAAVDRRVSEP